MVSKGYVYVLAAVFCGLLWAAHSQPTVTPPPILIPSFQKTIINSSPTDNFLSFCVVEMENCNCRCMEPFQRYFKIDRLDCIWTCMHIAKCKSATYTKRYKLCSLYDVVATFRREPSMQVNRVLFSALSRDMLKAPLEGESNKPEETTLTTKSTGLRRLNANSACLQGPALVKSASADYIVKTPTTCRVPRL